MSDETTNKTEKRKQLRKYAVFALMVLAFGISMWLIFAPSKADREKEEEQAGFNSDIPDPKGGGMVGDKKTAYEQEQMRQKQEEQRRSLQDYAFQLEGKARQADDLSLKGEEPAHAPAAIGRGGSGGTSGRQQPNSFQSSASAYRDINRTLGNFYETPKEDKEKEEMARKIEELESRLEEKEQQPGTLDDQVVLLEKSYELAAKYMPQGQGAPPQTPSGGTTAGGAEDKTTGTGNVQGGGKVKVTPVTQVRRQTVSALNQQVSNAELVRQLSVPRNMGFHSVDQEEGQDAGNTIAAVAHGDQTLIDGQRVRLRLAEAMNAGGTLIPANTLLTGLAKIQGERLEVSVASIEHEGRIIPVELTAYDTDGQRGIHIPGSMELNAAREVVANMGSNMGSSISITQQGAGEQLLTDMGRGLIQGASQYAGKKVRQVKVTLKAGYRMLLLPKNS